MHGAVGDTPDTRGQDIVGAHAELMVARRRTPTCYTLLCIHPSYRLRALLGYQLCRYECLWLVARRRVER